MTDTQINRPLFIDLDGTLVSTDTLWESCLLFIKKHPLESWKLIQWLLLGKAYFKDKVAERLMPHAELLPINDEILKIAEEANHTERDVYLITAANQRIADSVSKRFNIFTAAIGSSGGLNLSGKHKLRIIKNTVGNVEFDYIGNSKKDIPILEKSHTAIVYSSSKSLFKKLKKRNDNILNMNQGEGQKLKYWIKALRIYQWSKNILLFLALFMSHRILESDMFLKSIIAFFSFGFSASAVYILNDLFDLESDRQHPTKKERPFASGKLSVTNGITAIPILVILSFLLAIVFLPKLFTIVLIIYLLTTTSYSLYFKEILFVDVILLGTLYTLRIIAGGLATGIEVSSWLLGFSGFFFLSLAFMKRYTDLILFKNNSQEELFGRGYSVDDLDIVQKAGIASGFVSLLILALYITSEQVMVLYNRPLLMWLTIPIILYWLMCMWIETHRGKMTDDPIIYAVKDKNSYLVFFLMLVVIVCATIL